MPLKAQGDFILIEGLELEMLIGVHAHERTARQRVLIDISLEILTPPKGWGADDFAETVSYETLATRVRSLADTKHFNLVEHFAEEIARLCLSHDGTLRAEVTVKKPDIMGGVVAVGCRLVRSSG